MGSIWSLMYEALVIGNSVDIDERTVIVNLNISGRGSVRAHDDLRTLLGTGPPDFVEEGAIDQNGMAVFASTNGPDDRRSSLTITIDHGANRRWSDERYVDERDQRRDHPRPIDGVQAFYERR